MKLADKIEAEDEHDFSAGDECCRCGIPAAELEPDWNDTCRGWCGICNQRYFKCMCAEWNLR